MATVLLTGASGFLGIHTVKQLLDEGHLVRALVRSGRRLADNLGALGIDVDDQAVQVVAGDMTDRAAVEKAAAGCEAVVHAAATFSYKRRDRAAMTEQNAVGTRIVLEAGASAGCRTLVHVSSTVALNRRGAGVLDQDSPLGEAFGPYSASKIESERVARSLQESGSPVSIVYPGAVVGPHDPYLGESAESFVAVLQGRMPVWPRGRLHYVDVRDTAAVLVRAATREAGGRYLVPGHAVRRPHDVLREVTGRRLPALTVPTALAVVATAPGYLAGWSFLPAAMEAPRSIGCGNTVDSSVTTTELGVSARPVEEAFADTVQWLLASGHISVRQAGRLGG